ncbi:MAG TPA: tetratricopeptide repeat protein [Pyrinomonadaceae bacterium]|jgi:Flp pilus assembly protein TadD
MPRQTLIILTLTVALIVAVEPLQTVQGVLLSETDIATLNAANAVAIRDDKSESGGNSFVRALGAPFKAIGRLFGRRKKDENKLQRITEKDIKKFKSAPAEQTRVTTAAQSNAAAQPEANAVPNTTGNFPTDDAAKLAAEASAHLEKGRQLLNSGKANEAIEELSKAASLDRTLAEARTLLGVAYESKGLHDLAMKSFSAAVEAQNNNPQHLNNLGYALYVNGDYEAATKYLKRAVKLAPDNARIWNNLGLAQCERGKFDDAFKSFAHAVGEYKSRLTIAARLQKEGFTKDAIKHLEKARALKPNSPEVLAQLVKLYELSDKNEQAEDTRRTLMAVQSLATAPVPE